MSFIGSMATNNQGAGFLAGGSNTVQTATAEDANQTAARAINAQLQQQSFVDQLQGTQGLQNQQLVFNQQQGLANQLQQQAMGQGPNLVQAQLAQNTGQNIAAQGALAAGQRGVGQNAGMLARQVGQQGAATQQGAVGQAATLGAQQQLAAQQALAQQQASMQGVAGNQVNQAASGYANNINAAQGEQGQVLGAIGNYNNAQVGMQSNENNTNAEIAKGNQASQQEFASSLGAFGMKLADGGPVEVPPAQAPAVGSLSVPSTPGGPPANNNHQNTMISDAMGSVSGLMGGGSGGGGMMSMLALLADGGEVQQPMALAPQEDPLGTMPQQAAVPQIANHNGPKSQVGQILNTGGGGDGSFANNNHPNTMIADAISSLGGGGSQPQATTSQMLQGTPDASLAGMGGTMMAANGGKVPAMVSPGEVYIPPSQMREVAKGKDPIKAGERIPGKAKVKGDSLKNDTVPATLEEGGVVLPKSIMESKNPHWAAHKFVSDIMARQGLKGRR